MALSRPTGAAIADGVAVGTIVNSDPMPAAYLARFGRTVAEQALDGISGRMAVERTPGTQGTLAGQAMGLGSGSADGTIAANDHAPLGNGLTGPGFSPGLSTPDMQWQTMTGLDLLLGSSFTATGEKDSYGGSLAFWGRAAQSNFDGQEGTFSLDGEVTTGMLGADYARDQWLFGMALMQSRGTGGYQDNDMGPQHCSDAGDSGDPAAREFLCGGAVREGDGEVESSLTAVVPYAAFQASERLKLWGSVGYGTGEVTLKPDLGGALDADLSWAMAAMGLRGDLLTPPKPGSGPALALTSDALWARTSSDQTHELAASDSDVTRLRLGLEGSYRIVLEEGAQVTPKLEIGARQDGGDAETGFGVEIGGGLAWSDPRLGLTLDLTGRTLLAHENNDLKDQGFAASLAFDPDPATRRGPSLTLTQDWGGPAQGGLDALFATDPLADRTGSETASRWTAEAAWGFPAFSGRFIGSPHLGLGLAPGARDYTLGWQLTPASRAHTPAVSFGVQATRQEGEAEPPEHVIGVEVQVRW